MEISQLLQQAYKHDLHLIDGELNGLSYYSILWEKAKEICPNEQLLDDFYAFRAAFDIIIYQFSQGDNHGFANKDMLKSSIEHFLEYTEIDDIWNLLGYFGFFNASANWVEDDEAEFIYNEDTEDKLSRESYINMLTFILLEILEKQLSRLKIYLTYTTENTFWYKIMGGEGNDYEQDRILGIVHSLLH